MQARTHLGPSRPSQRPARGAYQSVLTPMAASAAAAGASITVYYGWKNPATLKRSSRLGGSACLYTEPGK
jgi:hypothetical protein